MVAPAALRPRRLRHRLHQLLHRLLHRLPLLLLRRRRLLLARQRLTPSPGGAVTCAPGDAPQVRATTFTLINLTRTTLGLPQLARLPAFDGTAQAHAQYVVANNSPALGRDPGPALLHRR